MRLYNFDSIYNFRDFGDYPSQNKGHILPKRLFRSAHLAKAHVSELEIISHLDISLIVDLRYKSERERQANRLLDGYSPKVLEFENYKPSHLKTEIAPHEMFMQNDLHSADDARQYMLGSYSARPHDPGFVSIFSKTLKYMAQHGEPILIHCAAGKDRTGTLAALIQSICGVDRDLIISDYMLTLKAVDIETLLEPVSKHMSERYNRSITPDQLRPMFGVEPDYLQASMEAMGDMDHYVHDILGISHEERDQIHAHYLK